MVLRLTSIKTSPVVSPDVETSTSRRFSFSVSPKVVSSNEDGWFKDWAGGDSTILDMTSKTIILDVLLFVTAF